MAVTQIFGASVRRREDPRLITGRATFIDDIVLPGMLHAAILRSPHAHARIRSINVERARAHPGVVAVFTGADLQGKVGNIACAWLIPNADLKLPPHPPLAVDRVRYVGDGVAVVVAEDRYTAHDALELIEVDYEVLPAVVSVEKAIEPGAPQLHDEAPGNVAFRWKVSGGDVDRAFSEAEVVVKERLVHQRLIPNAMETRGCVASWHRGSGELTVWATSQNPHIHRFLMSGDLGIPEHKLRVITPEIGGGFGSKIPHYPDETIIAFCAMQLNRPVKWIEDRRENYTATTHGRDHVQDVEICGRRDGTITGLRARILAGMGAYLSTAAPGVPTILCGLMMNGAYKIPHILCETVGVLTNTTPVDAYRGAGRPEMTFLVERMVDLFAREIGMDPVEVRRKNFIQAHEFPYTTSTGLTYDSGNYELTLNRALEILDYQAARAEQARLRQQGRYMGIGLSTYVEICGLGPSQVAGAVGFQGGLWENAVVRLTPTGKATVFTGANPHGQGEETTFAQIVAHELGIPLDDIEVVHGDTARIPMGWGTYGSRTTAVGGSAVALAARKVREKARKIAAHMLEASEEDIVFEQGRFYVRGAPDRAKTIQDVALAAFLAWDLPPGVEPGLEESSFYDPQNFTYPFGAHIAVVEIDPETGRVDLKRYIAVDDCGNVINPMIVDGQVHGGVAQGIGQALLEQAVYSEDGQLLTGTMLDYTVPRASHFPRFELDRTVTPTPHNPIGAKGVGETGTIAASAAIINAICDALAPLGIRHVDMPATPEKIWRLIRQARPA
jgi:carbon-monoxide dehydrogenase large subunit